MIRIILLFLIFFSLLLTTCQIFASSVDYDTTRIRETKPVKKSTGEKIADIPGEILKSPIYIFEYTTKTIVLNPPFSYGLSLIKFGGRTVRYFPVVGYSSRAGLKFGFGYKPFEREKDSSLIRLKWHYSTNKYQSYLLNSRFGIKSHYNWMVELNARYQKKTRESFYGIGDLSKRDYEVNYTSEITEFESKISFLLLADLSFDFEANYQITNIFDGEDPDLTGDIDLIKSMQSLNLSDGSFDSFRHIGLGFSFNFDNIRNKGQPMNGTYLSIGFNRIHGVKRSNNLDFNVYSLELRKYVNMWRKRIIAVRMISSIIDSDDSNLKAIPIYLASNLGGIEKLRGFNRSRFIDNDFTFISLEYRYPVYDMLDAFMFLDEGRVYHDLTKSKVLDNWRHSFGFGFRIYNRDEALMSIQIARSDESTQFYFELGATW